MDSLRMPWSKKDTDPQEFAVHGALAANIFGKSTTDRENEESLQEDFLITNSNEIIDPLMGIAKRDQELGNGQAFTNFSIVAAAARNAPVRRCTNLKEIDVSIGTERNRILFRKIASHASREDIRHGILNLLEVAHQTADETLLDSTKGWKTKCIKLRTQSQEVIMSKRQAPRRFPGMGGESE